MHCYRHPNRETYVSCSECGRGICPDCMVFGPVGIRCPDHAKSAAVAPRQRARMTARRFSAPAGIVTRTLIGVNVAIYLLELATGAPFNGSGGTIWEHGVLYGPVVANGDWWRLITAAFLHYGPIHLGMNMLALWIFGQALEIELGPWRYLLLYLVSGLAGSAGALIVSPEAATVGASGAIFGILGAAVVLEARGRHVFGGGALGLLVLNLAFTAFVPGVSIGGHLGGLAAGAAGGLVFSKFGRRRPALTTLSMVAVGLVSVLVAYQQVQQYT
jgi:membrane associated rhomboid family serine protease